MWCCMAMPATGLDQNVIRCLKLAVSDFPSLLLPMSFFGSLTLISLTFKAFQTLLSKHIFSTEILFAILGSQNTPLAFLALFIGSQLFPAFPPHFTHPSEPLHIILTLENQADYYTSCPTNHLTLFQITVIGFLLTLNQGGSDDNG